MLHKLIPILFLSVNCWAICSVWAAKYINPEHLRFSIDALSYKIRIEKTMDIAQLIKISPTGDLSPCEMAALLKKVHSLLEDHNVIFVRWQPAFNRLQVERNPFMPEDYEGHIILKPSMLVHDLSSKQINLVERIIEKYRNSSAKKILWEFDGLSR